MTSPAKRLHVLLLVAIFCLATAAALKGGPDPVDDAYITFRFARNLVQGEGYAYNPGHRVLGSTTPLYTLLLALGGTVLGSAAIPVLAWIIGALSQGFGAIFLYGLARRGLHPVVAVAVAVMFALSPEALYFSRGGMEASLFNLLVLSSAWSVASGRVARAYVLAALSLLTRPEGLLWLGLLGAYGVLTRPRSQIKGLLAAAAVVVPWLVFATLYFGSPVPHSITAKQLAYQHYSEQRPLFAVLSFVQYMNWRWWGDTSLSLLALLEGPEAYATPVPSILGGMLTMTLMTLGARYMAPRQPVVVLLTLYPVVHAVLIGRANPVLFGWYFVPLLPGVLLSVAGGLEWLFLKIDQRVSPPLRKLRLGVSLPLLIIATNSLFNLPDEKGRARGWFGLHTVGTEREAIYGSMARSLLEGGADPSDTLGGSEIGALGWVWPGPILDTVGLVSPEALGYLPTPKDEVESSYGVPVRMIQALQPRYFVTMDIFVRRSLLRDPWFLQSYGLVEAVPYQLWGSRSILLLRRVGPATARS